MEDRNHNLVKIGDKVRLLKINPLILDGLPKDEIIELSSMLDQLFEITMINEKFIVIEKSFNYDEDKISSHELYIYSSDEFELIQ